MIVGMLVMLLAVHDRNMFGVVEQTLFYVAAFAVVMYAGAGRR